MSFFSRSSYGPEPNFTSLFRLLDDFDTYRNECPESGQRQDGAGGSAGGSGGLTRSISRVRTFSPKFDVHETENTYELYGEFPGIKRDNINIEFAEPQTLVVRGRVERSYQSGNPPAGLIGDGSGEQEQRGAMTEFGEVNKRHSGRKVTVEDEKPGTDVAKASSDNTNKKDEHNVADRLWVSERSIGEFSRTFSFPSRVDQDAVSAKLENGILNVTVPKAKKLESRRIAIS